MEGEMEEDFGDGKIVSVCVCVVAVGEGGGGGGYCLGYKIKILTIPFVSCKDSNFYMLLST
jgi:hypothetical protein